MNTAPVTELRDNIRQIVDDVVTTGDEYVITRHGRRVAVIISYEDFESLTESLNLLSDDEAMAAIAAGLREADAGLATDLTEE